MKRLARYCMMAVALLVVALVSSCGSSSKMTARVSHSTDKGKPVTDVKIDSKLPSDTKTLLAEARTWLGVPYAWGGNDRNGVDCSGFVTQVFQNALHIKLPRTSASQCEFCETVDRHKMQPGDLVFFDTTGAREGRVSHVGLYIGDGNMIHASSSKGVIVSTIDGAYFSERLLKAGRVAGLGNADATSVGKTEKKAVAATPKARKQTAPVQPATVSAAANAITTPDDARSLVLDMLVEQKLDSIYSR